MRYYGALGPCSPLRSAVNCAAKWKATSAALKPWAACMRKAFEVDPVLCAKCGGEMKLAAVILDDGELGRILAHQGTAATSRPAISPRRRADAPRPAAAIFDRRGKKRGEGRLRAHRGGP